MEERADDRRRRLDPLTVAAVWLALLLLGVVTILADRLLAAPAAAPAKKALLSLIAGEFNPGADGIAAILVYACAIFLAPLLILAAFAAIESRTSGRRSGRGSNQLAWLVQAVFITTTNILLILMAQLELRPDPLIRIQSEPGSSAYWLQIIPLFLLSLIIGDILIYWVHRAQHHFAFLWRFHSIHHSQDLDVLRNINHPVEMVTNYLLVTIPVGLLVRIDAAELLALAAFFAIQGWLNHLRAPIHLGPLGVLLSDNRYHFIHHSRDPADFNSNFAARFPFVDMLFGTYRRRRPALPATGLADRPPPTSLRHYLLASWRDTDQVARPGVTLAETGG